MTKEISTTKKQVNNKIALEKTYQDQKNQTSESSKNLETKLKMSEKLKSQIKDLQKRSEKAIAHMSILKKQNHESEHVITELETEYAKVKENHLNLEEEIEKAYSSK